MKISSTEKENILACLQELSNLESQKETWLQNKKSHNSSPTELIYRLFNRTKLNEYIDSPNTQVFSYEINEKFEKIRNLLYEINTYWWPITSLLYHPKWIEVCNLAFEILLLIEEKNKSQREPEYRIPRWKKILKIN